MAIKLNTSYSKKLGLPGYSSHAFSASVEVELGDLSQAGAECARLYGLLQASVDHEIRHTGFVPDHTYGMEPPANGIIPMPSQASQAPPPSENRFGMSGAANGNGHEPHPRANGYRNGSGNGNGSHTAPGWQCSPKQRELIRSIMDENGLTDERVDGLAMQRFGVALARLNKLQASGLIDELLESFGGRGKPRSGNGNGSTATAQGNGGAR